MNIIITKNNWRFILNLLGEKYQFEYGKEFYYDDLEESFEQQNDPIPLIYYATINENKIRIFTRVIPKENKELIEDLINFEYGR
jgi:hypothetical protein